MSGLFCASLAAFIPNVTFSRISYSKLSQRGCKNDRMGLVPSPASCIYMCRNRTETSKEKTFKINAKIEDVGLNED